MKKIHFCFILLLLFSCSKENGENVNPENIKFSADEIRCIEFLTKNNRITLDNVKETAISFIRSSDVTRSSNLNIENIEAFTVESKSMTKSINNQIDTLMYAVNFSNNAGYVIVSSDNRTSDIFGYSDEGKIDLNHLKPGQDIVFQALESMYYNQIKASKRLVDSLSEQVLDKLSSLGSKTITKSNTKSQIPGFEVKVGEWYDLPGSKIQLCNTSWDQGSPYNAHCFTKNGEQAVAGCIPIAIAQILVYHKSYPSGKNWLSIEKAGNNNATSEENDLAARLINEIGKDVNVTYGVKETGGSDWQIAKYLKPGFSFYIKNQFIFWPDLIDYDMNEVLYSIGKHISPVIITGFNKEKKGHAWIISGMNTQERVKQLLYYGSVVSETKEPIDYIYHNYGLGAGSNGYILTSKELKYPVDTKIIPSLTKK